MLQSVPAALTKRVASNGDFGACVEQRVTSIPSKFETVLHRDATERNAFGNRTQRFGDHDVSLHEVVAKVSDTTN